MKDARQGRSGRTPSATALLVAGAAATALVLLPEPVSAQCAMCKRLLATPEGQQLVAGFRHGILLLLAAPFLAFGSVAILAVRLRRRASDDDAPDA